MKRIAIFASGGGSNAQKILEHFKNHPTIEVALIVTNTSNAGVIEHAKTFNIDSVVLSKKQLKDFLFVINLLKSYQIDFVVLAGYLKQIGKEIIQKFPERIMNIHPSLLPKYGGKGMYGINVHKAVKQNGDKVSGPTIHLVNEEYDKGQILFQKEVQLESTDSPEKIASRVLALEHQEYPQVIESYVTEYYKGT